MSDFTFLVWQYVIHFDSTGLLNPQNIGVPTEMLLLSPLDAEIEELV
jgi:hypothetical protein